ncbi:hypothetical protein BB560_001124 [Smittium megazygosporum]|uniref:Uncharacterized protein n=1 Tax=Smittium megazygosporum TaxID=133381 RepID=A0A2T9ZIG2_9FUNG|nr:hypothetical protein BB560_001124 [Smittium megazygosporum]
MIHNTNSNTRFASSQGQSKPEQRKISVNSLTENPRPLKKIKAPTFIPFWATKTQNSPLPLPNPALTPGPSRNSSAPSIKETISKIPSSSKSSFPPHNNQKALDHKSSFENVNYKSNILRHFSRQNTFPGVSKPQRGSLNIFSKSIDKKSPSHHDNASITKNSKNSRDISFTPSAFSSKTSEKTSHPTLTNHLHSGTLNYSLPTSSSSKSTLKSNSALQARLRSLQNENDLLKSEISELNKKNALLRSEHSRFSLKGQSSRKSNISPFHKSDLSLLFEKLLILNYRLNDTKCLSSVPLARHDNFKTGSALKIFPNSKTLCCCHEIKNGLCENNIKTLLFSITQEISKVLSTNDKKEPNLPSGGTENTLAEKLSNLTLNENTLPENLSDNIFAPTFNSSSSPKPIEVLQLPVSLDMKISLKPLPNLISPRKHSNCNYLDLKIQPNTQPATDNCPKDTLSSRVCQQCVQYADTIKALLIDNDFYRTDNQILESKLKDTIDDFNKLVEIFEAQKNKNH